MHENIGPRMIDKLYVFNHTVELSGGEISLLGLLRGGMAKEVVLATDSEGPLTEAVRNGRLAGVTVHTAGIARADYSLVGVSGSRGNPFVGLLQKVRRATKMRKFYQDILASSKGAPLYANSLRSALILATLRRGSAVLIYHQRDRLKSDYLGVPAAVVVRAILRWRVDWVIANSMGTKDSSPVPAAKISVIPSAVAPAFYKMSEPPSSEPIQIIMVGRLAPWKGQLEFLDALSLLSGKSHLPEWRAHIVGGALFGESDYEAQIIRFIASSGLSSVVEMTGHVSDVLPYFEKSDIVVHASVIPEPFGQVVAQAMASGRATIAASSGGPTEMIEDGITGLLVDPTVSSQLAHAIEMFLTDAALRRRLGRDAAVAAQIFNADLIQKRLSDFLESAETGGRSTAYMHSSLRRLSQWFRK
jgi:glycosyltransferase involved in cell wall biosynthesis